MYYSCDGKNSTTFKYLNPSLSIYNKSTMGNRLGLPLVPRESWPADRTYMNQESTPTNQDLHNYLMTCEFYSPVEKKAGLLSSLSSYIWSEPTPPIEVKPSNVRHEETFTTLRKLLAKNLAYLDYKSKHQSDEPYLRRLTQLPEQTMGVFATANIPKGTLICRIDPSNTYDLKINDLAYYAFMPNYEYLDISNIKQHINVRGIDVQGVKYLQAIKDIKKGEELSRLYGYDYWFKDIKEIHNWNVPFGLEQKSAGDKDKTKLENQLELAMKARSDSMDSDEAESITPVLLIQVNSAIDDSFLDEAKATTLKKIAQFLAKQKDKQHLHELENQIIRMLKNRDVDW
jgi:hypothetical protein